MNRDKLALVYRYALVVAQGNDSPRDRGLGPIHLLKLAYLADLAAAEQSSGRSFTETGWIFHKFGPYSAEAFLAMDDLLGNWTATKVPFRSAFREDAFRWECTDQSSEDRLEPLLPHAVAAAIRRSVREFGTDTVSLLHHVYRTVPILRAKPGERLSFDGLAPRAPRATAERVPSLLSKTAIKRVKGLLAAARERRASSERTARAAPSPPPRYDEVFRRGTEWLDSLVGEPIQEERGVLTIGDSVWQSEARSDADDE